MPAPSEPFFSIIVASYNCESTIERALSSVLCKQFDLLEVLVVDGGSKDSTFGKILNFRDSRVAFSVSEADKGVYDAWNKALSRVKGDWIIFLGADDVISDETNFEELEVLLRDVPNDVLLVQVPITIHDEVSQRSYIWPPARKPLSEISSDDVAAGRFAHPGILHRRIAFELYGNFDTRFRIAGDMEFLLRVLQQGKAEITRINTSPLIRFSVGGMSSSLNKRYEAAKEAVLAFKTAKVRLPLHRIAALVLGAFISVFAHIFGESRCRKVISFLKGLFFQ